MLMGGIMNIEDTFRYMIAGRYGVELIEEYKLKEYMLIEMDNYINDFINTNEISFDVDKVKEEVRDTYSDRVKLQDSLLILQSMEAPMELVFLVKSYLKKLGRKDNF